MIEIQTFCFVVGFGNLAFALLAWLYTLSLPADNRVLTLWRWAKLLTGIAYTVSWLKPQLPPLPPWLFIATEFNFAFTIVGVGLELAAYSLFLGRAHWLPYISRGVIPLALLAFLISVVLGATRGPALAVLTAIGVFYYSAMAFTMFTCRGKDRRLLRLMGAVDGAAALVYVSRVASSLLVATLVPFAPIAVTIASFVMLYVTLIINGFGFLLLVKQDGDRALRAAIRDLSRAEAEQRQLLSMASHEFRTPSAMIKTSLDSLRFLGDRIPPEVENRLGNIRLATTRMIDLTNSLIDQDRLEERVLTPQKTDIDLTRLTAEIVQNYPAGDNPRPVQLPTRSPAPGPVSVAADPDLLRIAVNNLIDNALRYGGEQPVSLQVVVRPDAVHLRVADSGPGIPDGEKEKIFLRFYGLKSDETSGLGLSIVSSIARAHGGQVVALDNEPRGAMLVLSLPLPS